MRSFGGLFTVAAVFSTIALSGCSSAVGCDFREVGEGLNNGPEPRCQERTNLQALSFGPACAALSAKVVEGGCPHEGIAFGCEVSGGGGDVIDWYYAPKTRAANAESECGSEKIVDAP